MERRPGKKHGILECSKVSKRFGGLAAVSNVDLKVEAGDILGLIGPNGPARQLCSHDIRSDPVKSGTINLKEADQWPKTASDLPGRASPDIPVGQDFGNMTVLTNVRLAALFGRTPGLSSSRPIKSCRLLEFTGLSAMKDVPAKDLGIVSQNARSSPGFSYATGFINARRSHGGAEPLRN